MTPPLRDPAGLLERAPELANLAAADAAVRRAIERGNPHAVHRALWWGRLLGRFKEHRATVDALLSHRRLFVAPLRRMPVLFTMNGLGASLYGSSDADADQTYVKTHFLVFVFVPVFPLSQYLVRDAEKGWYFLGKVPMSAPVRLWNRLVVAGILTALGVGAFEAFYASRHHEVHVLNGLPLPVRASIGGVTFDVPANGRVAKSLATGKHDVRVADASGDVIESGMLEVSAGGTDVQAWNVLGAAPVFSESISYGNAAAAPNMREPHLFCGERVIREAGVDFAFAEPPQSIQMPKGQSVVVRRRVGISGAGLELCVNTLYGGTLGEPALALGRGLLSADVTGRPVQLAGALLRTFATPEELFSLAQKARERHPNSVEHHRLYQAAAQVQGKGAELTEEYRARFEATPDSADAAYLYLRLLPRDEKTRTQAASLVQKFPDHVPLHRTVVFRSIRALRWSDAVASLERMQKLDRGEWVAFLDDHLAALAALGRVEDAKTLAREAFAKGEGSKPYLAGVHSWLSGDTGEAAETLLAKLAVGKPNDALALRVRFWTAPADAVIGILPTEDRAVYELLQHAHFKPPSALDDAAKMTAETLEEVNSEVLLLLVGEATRAGHQGARERLDATIAKLQMPVEDVHAYLEHGTWSSGLDDLDMSDQGALHLARSRQAALGASVRGELRALAGRCDPVGGYVRKALDQWPRV